MNWEQAREALKLGVRFVEALEQIARSLAEISEAMLGGRTPDTEERTVSDG